MFEDDEADFSAPVDPTPVNNRNDLMERIKSKLKSQEDSGVARLTEDKIIDLIRSHSVAGGGFTKKQVEKFALEKIQPIIDQAALGVNLFTDQASGLAGTSPGEFFGVATQVGDSSVQLFFNVDGTTATAYESYPSLTALNNALAQMASDIATATSILNDAEAAKNATENARDEAFEARDLAETSKTVAFNHAAAAADSVSKASISEKNASESALKSATSAALSATSEQNAATSEANAKVSETRSKDSEDDAALSASLAAQSANLATTAADRVEAAIASGTAPIYLNRSDLDANLSSLAVGSFAQVLDDEVYFKRHTIYEITSGPTATFRKYLDETRIESELFTISNPPDTIDTVGRKEVTEVSAVGDSSGSLAGKHFRVYGAALNAGAIKYTQFDVAVDIWYEVGGLGTQPLSGANRYIKVAVATNASAADVASATVSSVNTDPAFSAHLDPSDPTKFYIVSEISGNTTDALPETSGFSVSTVSDGRGERPSTDIYSGGVLAPNGHIYFIPSQASSVLKLNPNTREFVLFGNLGTSSLKWDGGTLAKNGCIYCVPQNSSTVLKIDTRTDTVTTFGSLSGSLKWSGCVLDPESGNIYCIPYDSTQVLKIDPETDTVTLFGNLSGTAKWNRGVYADGYIYGIPRNSDKVLKINPLSDTVETFGSLTTASSKWSGGVFANGAIYGIPDSSDDILKIVPGSDTISTIPSGQTGSSKWRGGVVAGGMVYGIPSSSPLILKLDPSTDTVSTFGNLEGTSKFNGGNVSNNGVVYCVPASSTAILEIHTGSKPSLVELSAYYNKF